MSSAPFQENTVRRRAGESIEDIALAALEQATHRPDCFVSLCSIDDITAQAKQVETALAADAELPLAGLTFCVKDNIDVSGLQSSSNCPGYGRIASETAPAVQMALDAGAILIGKNTMDQFATGLNGTRSPAPICQNAIDPTIIPGGSSSGSAVAVATGLCDFSFGSDTGGSGRVPAAANGIVGFKPTPGLISGRGMVYCNRSFDVIPVFTKTVAEAAHIFDVVGGADPLDPFAYEGTIAAEPRQIGRCYAIPRVVDHFGDDAARAAHEANLERLIKAGASFKEIDFSPFADAGELVFKSALVAERLVDYGDFIAQNPQAVIPAVAQAITPGRDYTALEVFKVLHHLAELRVQCRSALADVDALVLPTIPRLFTVDEMTAEPMQRNTIMGTYTYFANPLGLSAIAVPGERRADGLPSSVCFIGLGGRDREIMAHARAFESDRSKARCATHHSRRQALRKGQCRDRNDCS